MAYLLSVQNAGDERPRHLHSPLGAELLAAEAVDAFLPVDGRQPFTHRDSLRRADLGAFAAADALCLHGTRLGAQALVQERRQRLPRLAGQLFAEEQIVLRHDALKIRHKKSIQIARDRESRHVRRDEAALVRLLQRGHILPRKADDVRAGEIRLVRRPGSQQDSHGLRRAGGRAVALNSASNAGKFAEALAKKKPKKALIIALDDDEAGHKAAKVLKDALDALNVSNTPFTSYGGAKDANEALTSYREGFAQAIAEAQRRAMRPDNVADFMLNRMMDEMEALRAQATRKTGFANLDREAGSIYNGLYVVGGISSVGKTSFLAQLCDQMAAQGQHVLFFSLEQSRLEIVSKSIARRTAQKDFYNAVTGLDVRMGNITPAMLEAIEGHINEVGERVNVIEGNFGCTASFIHDYTARYIEQNGVRPVVIVDYLQVMQPDLDPDTGRKITDKRLATDQSVTELKRMSRDFEIPVFVVSSVNRSSYLTPIDFEAFKESGGIEFTADVVWGLQLTAVNDDLFKDDDKGKVKRRERLAEAKDAIPRDVELVCLKNRYGRSRYRARFDYYPQYDYYRPTTY